MSKHEQIFPDLDPALRISSKEQLAAAEILMGSPLWEQATDYQKRVSVDGLSHLMRGRDIRIDASPSAGKTRIAMMLAEAIPQALPGGNGERGTGRVISASHTRAIHNQTIADYQARSIFGQPGEFVSHRDTRPGQGAVLTMVGHLLSRGDNRTQNNMRAMGRAIMDQEVKAVIVDEAHHFREDENAGYSELLALTRAVNSARAQKDRHPEFKAPMVFLSATFGRDDRAKLHPRIEEAVPLFISPSETLGKTALPVRTKVSDFVYKDGGRAEGQAHDLAFKRFGRTPKEAAEAIQDHRLEASITKSIRAARERPENAGWLDAAIDTGEKDSPTENPQMLVFFDELDEIEKYRSTFEARYPGQVGVIGRKTSRQDEEKVLDGLREGRLRAVLNCKRVDEGASVEGLDVVINARALLSRRELIQMAGRAARADHRRGKAEGLFVDAGAATFVRGTVEAQMAILDAKAGLKQRDRIPAASAIDALSSATIMRDAGDPNRQKTRRVITIADTQYALTRHDEKGEASYNVETLHPVSKAAQALHYRDGGKVSPRWPADALADHLFEVISDRESDFARNGGPFGKETVAASKRFAEAFPQALKRREQTFRRRRELDPASRRVRALQRVPVKMPKGHPAERMRLGDLVADGSLKATGAAQKVAESIGSKFATLSAKDPRAALVMAEAAHRAMFETLPPSAIPAKLREKVRKVDVARESSLGLQENWLSAASEAATAIRGNRAVRMTAGAEHLVSALAKAGPTIRKTIRLAQQDIRKQGGKPDPAVPTAAVRPPPQEKPSATVSEAARSVRQRREDIAGMNIPARKRAVYERACEIRRRHAICNAAIERKQKQMYGGADDDSRQSSRQAWARLNRARVRMEKQYETIRREDATRLHGPSQDGCPPAAPKEGFPDYDQVRARMKRTRSSVKVMQR
ncbi:helicase-related protein [Tranquillimonas alkanivorans]|uniref:Superfamily II DNA or RNA helicase n=1 Tax=Tranquillimonas alkanivorans TaxID=441119 RepID=A0A1I5TS85_9RHOB|nr:DEAD/DEAH box helicase [Tranquillimonas alkanivorans]SFP85924.1 Superfamily II DNA or RNA helicase [Tranquillimonas alkanivorans]